MIIAGYRRIAGQASRGGEAALLAARLAVGWLMLLHGLRKFTGPGGVAAFQHLLTTMPNVPFPVFTGAVLPWVEVVGAVMLLTGMLTRLAALVLAAELAIIVPLVKFQDMHAGVIGPGGAELEFLFIAALLVPLLLGPGRLSVDALAGLEARAAGGRPQQPVTGQPASTGSHGGE